jgi:hypothetical protein
VTMPKPTTIWITKRIFVTKGPDYTVIIGSYGCDGPTCAVGTEGKYKGAVPAGLTFSLDRAAARPQGKARPVVVGKPGHGGTEAATEETPLASKGRRGGSSPAPGLGFGRITTGSPPSGTRREPPAQPDGRERAGLVRPAVSVFVADVHEDLARVRYAGLGSFGSPPCTPMPSDRPPRRLHHGAARSRQFSRS